MDTVVQSRTADRIDTAQRESIMLYTNEES